MKTKLHGWNRRAGAGALALALGLPALGASVALAQENSAATTPKLEYRSVFNQYQGYREQPVAPWRGTNDAVEKIGGWRVYAREARQAADKTTATPRNTDTPSEQGRKP